MNIVVDIDDTLLITPKKAINGVMTYMVNDTKAIQNEIDLVNGHYKRGDILLHLQ